MAFNGVEALAGPPRAEGLRDRRRRELRDELSDVAARMFLERGFAAVRVADIARAVGVTEKTVFNHFPTKEALIADRWAVMTARVAKLLRDDPTSVGEIALRVLAEELSVMLEPRASGQIANLQDLAKFRDLIEATPVLRAHELEAMHRLTRTIAEALGDNSAGEKQPESVADAIRWARAWAVVGLWQVFYRSLRHHLEAASNATSAAELSAAVLAEIRAAYRAVSIDG